MHISAHLDIDVVALERNDEVSVMLQLVAPEAPEVDARPGQTIVVVLDRSGSMAGGPLEGAKTALERLVSRLAPKDQFGLVVFDGQAQIAVPVSGMTELHKHASHFAIRNLRPGGSTNLSGGYLLGVREARRSMTDTGATVLLISDGEANDGETSPVVLEGAAAKAAGADIRTATLGYGLGYDEVLLAAIARGGRGDHVFTQNPDEAIGAVAAQVEGLLATTVQNAQLVIRTTDDVTKVVLLNDLPAFGLEDELVIEVGDLYGGEERKVLLSFGVPAMAALGLAQIATIELRYLALPELVEHTVTLPVHVNVVPEDIAAHRVANPAVVAEKAVLEVQSAKTEAAAMLRDGRGAEAVSSLIQASDRLRKLSAEISPSTEDAINTLSEEIRELDGLAERAGWDDAAGSSKAVTMSQSTRSRTHRRAPNTSSEGEG